MIPGGSVSRRRSRAITSAPWRTGLRGCPAKPVPGPAAGPRRLVARTFSGPQTRGCAAAAGGVPRFLRRPGFRPPTRRITDVDERAALDVRTSTPRPGSCGCRPAGHVTQPGLSFFDVGGDGLITRITDFWPEPYEPPGNRAHLVERG